jgi:uncharacterized protein
MNQADEILQKIRPELGTLRRLFGVQSLELFGSWVRGEAGPGSDVDLLVDFDRPTFDAYMDLKFHLEAILGRPVDLVMRRSLKPALRERILREAVDVA